MLCRLFISTNIFGRGVGGARNDSWHRVLIMLGTSLSQPRDCYKLHIDYLNNRVFSSRTPVHSIYYLIFQNPVSDVQILKISESVNCVPRRRSYLQATVIYYVNCSPSTFKTYVKRVRVYLKLYVNIAGCCSDMRSTDGTRSTNMYVDRISEQR